MATPKTQLTGSPVSKFLDQIPDETRRADCKAIAQLMEQATKAKGEMYGASIVGFGHRKYVYPNGKEMDWMVVGFSPRKQAIVLYGLGLGDEEALGKLGKHSHGKGCLYVKALADIHLPTLKKMIRASVTRASKDL